MVGWAGLGCSMSIAQPDKTPIRLRKVIRSTECTIFILRLKHANVPESLQSLSQACRSHRHCPPLDIGGRAMSCTLIYGIFVGRLSDVVQDEEYYHCESARPRMSTSSRVCSEAGTIKSMIETGIFARPCFNEISHHQLCRPCTSGSSPVGPTHHGGRLALITE